MSYHGYKRGEQRLCVYCAKSALSIYHFAVPERPDSAPNYSASYMWLAAAIVRLGRAGVNGHLRETLSA